MDEQVGIILDVGLGLLEPDFVCSIITLGNWYRSHFALPLVFFRFGFPPFVKFSGNS